MPHDWEALKAPFTFDQINIRVGPKNKAKDKTKPLAYMDARNVMDRLDNVIGPAHWKQSYYEARGLLFCKIEIEVDGQWIGKCDGAGNSDIEAEKGAMSDAFKRAAVRWGIGRYLYGMDLPWVGLNPKWDKEVDPNEMPKLRRVYDGFIAGKPVKNPTKQTYEHLLDALNKCQTEKDLSDWKDMFSEDYRALPEDFRESMRGECARRKESIEKLQLAAA